ncbi:hypothetical protein ECZU36_60170 [Escherichia coli]|nr:hypothetical protein ECZU36_60170 [Escherichia coli]
MEESATDGMSQVKSAATQTFDGIAQNMAAMLTGSEQNWRSFTRSVLSMMTEILLKQAMVGIVGSIGSAIGGLLVAARPRQAVQPFRPLRRNSILQPEDLREPAANMSQRGLFTAVNLSSRGNQPDWRGESLPADARLCHRWLCRYTGQHGGQPVAGVREV